MQRQRGELVPVGEVIADLPGPIQAIRKTPPPARRGFTLADQVDQLVRASETTPDPGFMARLLALCSLPRSNPGNRHQYKRQNGPYTLYMLVLMYLTPRRQVHKHQLFHYLQTSDSRAPLPFPGLSYIYLGTALWKVFRQRGSTESFFVERAPFQRHALYVSLIKTAVGSIKIPIDIDCHLGIFFELD